MKMKTLKIIPIVLLVYLMVTTQLVSAQTFHRTLTFTADNIQIFCLNRAVSGWVEYDISYHLDKTSGKIDNLSWNAHGGEMYDAQTGEKFVFMDKGSDRLGIIWDFFNRPEFYNGVDLYDVEDGWLNAYMPSEMPGDGTFVNTYKCIIKGTKVTFFQVIQIHTNANGEVTVDFNTVRTECN
jgi:hypothetical protein